MPRVLVVDDEPDALELLQAFLEATSYGVITASDGEEALRKVKEEETGRQALHMGAFDYITKPVDLKYLERSLWTKIMMMTL